MESTEGTAIHCGDSGIYLDSGAPDRGLLESTPVAVAAKIREKRQVE